MELSQAKKNKYDTILSKERIHVANGKLNEKERKELKAYAIKKALKIGKYVRN